jgi:hypothetical protein
LSGGTGPAAAVNGVYFCPDGPCNDRWYSNGPYRGSRGQLSHASFDEGSAGPRPWQCVNCPVATGGQTSHMWWDGGWGWIIDGGSPRGFLVSRCGSCCTGGTHWERGALSTLRLPWECDTGYGVGYPLTSDSGQGNHDPCPDSDTFYEQRRVTHNRLCTLH